MHDMERVTDQCHIHRHKPSKPKWSEETRTVVGKGNVVRTTNTCIFFSIFVIIPYSLCFYNTRHTQIYSYQNTEVKRPSTTRNLGTRQKWHKIYLKSTKLQLSLLQDEAI